MSGREWLKDTPSPCAPNDVDNPWNQQNDGNNLCQLSPTPETLPADQVRFQLNGKRGRGKQRPYASMILLRMA